MRSLELLAPAKNLACGIAAIDHGADAVYIGASRFGARAAAGNSLDDIGRLCVYAHQYGAKVYVTVNTIVYDDEIEDTRQLLKALSQAQVDAVLIQDMALLEPLHSPDLTSLQLHASTQTDNRTPEKVRWLRSLGFRRVVLARELSVEEISEIHRQVPDVELEVFVHGALCVSYSGMCYASQYCFDRSANRGECAQFCRMKFDLVDADGQVIEHQRHLLSLKDLNQSDHLEELICAGAVSFKIEGRLKGVDYVKNVTAYYSERLNAFIDRHRDSYQRASRGHVNYTFRPTLEKTFNRGYTNYFLHGRTAEMASFDTPKAMGEFVGTVKEVRGNSFNVAGVSRFANGDGLCFLNSDHELEGFRVNRVEGNRLFPQKMPAKLKAGIRLYRNQDQEFEHLLSKPSAERKISIRMRLSVTADGFALQIDDRQPVTIVVEHQKALKSQRENIVRQLTKLGGTPYECVDVEMPSDFDFFIPSSLLANLRREAVAQLTTSFLKPAVVEQGTSGYVAMPADNYYARVPYLYNIANESSRSFYEQHGLHSFVPAFERFSPHGEKILMQCRFCLRHALGYCVKHGGRKPSWHEPLSLMLSDGRFFPLEFDCQRCQMNVLAP